MIIFVDKESLQEKLSIASRFVLTKLSSSSSLQGGMLRFKKNKLEIITTNLNDFFSTSLKIENDREKTIVVDIKKINEFLNYLPSGRLSLELGENVLTVVCGKTSGSFNLIAATDFPEAPSLTGKQYQLKTGFLKQDLPLVLFAAAADETRPILTGVSFALSGDRPCLAATNGFRLSVLFKEEKESFPEAVISARVLAEVVRLSGKTEETKIVFMDKEKMAAFVLGQDVICTRLVEGEFPPFEKVIPASHTVRVTLNKDELLKNIKSAAVFAREFSNVVVFEIKKDGLYLLPRTKEDKKTVIYQDGDVEGGRGRIAFNYKFVLDFLSAVATKKIVFEMTQSNAPAVFRVAGQENFLHIIMPVRTEEETT